MAIEDRPGTAPRSAEEGRPIIHPAWIVGGFFVVYVVVGIAAQAVSAIPASEEGSAIEAFTAGLLWILAIFGMVKAATTTGSYWALAFWLAFTAATGALAVDEIVGVHERTEPNLNDDWLKIVLWVATPIVLVLIVRMLSADRVTRIAWVVGFAFHTAYLVVELGDGEFFTLPADATTLKGAEEIFELLFLAAYAFGFWWSAITERRSALADHP